MAFLDKLITPHDADAGRAAPVYPLAISGTPTMEQSRASEGSFTFAGRSYNAIATLTGREWFGPQQPLPPVAPPDFEVRTFDYPFGVNLQATYPKSTEGVSFQQLISLADNYDLLRLVIETRKDQVSKMPWHFRLKQLPGVKIADMQSKTLTDPRIRDLTEFFKKPDGDHSWQQWIRAVLEDIFVTDALSIYPRRTNGGGIWAIDVVDGQYIKRLIDQNGRTPQPPSFAYQQIIKGLPATNIKASEMAYCPRNIRSRRIYGFGPVEQILITINLALRRQMSQLAYYTSGNVPEMIISAPDTWSLEEIDKLQKMLDQYSGDLQARRRMWIVPEAKNILQTKAEMLKDEMDEWLARVVCYCFSVPPTPFVRIMNRATSQSLQEAALAEGLIPLMSFLEEVMNMLIQDPYFINESDIEFAWQDEQQSDQLKQAQIDKIYVSMGKYSIDELRERDGEDPFGVPPYVLTGTGPIPATDIGRVPPPQPGQMGGGLLPQPGQAPPPPTTASARGVPIVKRLKKKTLVY